MSNLILKQDSNFSSITLVSLTFSWSQIESRNVNSFQNDFKIFSTSVACKKKKVCSELDQLFYKWINIGYFYFLHISHTLQDVKGIIT